MGSLERLRIALKASLWAWALYWPGTGLVLADGGLDLVSRAVIGGGIAMFLGVFLFGGLDTSESRTRLQFWIERPLYLLGLLVFFLWVSNLSGSPDETRLAAMRTFAALFAAGLLLPAMALAVHVHQQGLRWRDGADQLAILLGLSLVAAAAIVFDTWSRDGLGNPAATVLVLNWLSLLYPPLVLVAARPFRAPLRWRRVHRTSGDIPAAEPTQA